MDYVKYFIGFDDTDSSISGGCTTYIAALLVEKLIKHKCIFSDYPHLIRLNPIIPFKTRGNGAVALKLLVPISKIDAVKEAVCDVIKTHSFVDDPKTNPGVVFWNVKKQFLPNLENFARNALHELVNLDDAFKLAQKINADIFYLGNGSGIVGGLSAIGLPLTDDFTYELIAYRNLMDKSPLRPIDPYSVKLMDIATHPLTFNNIDYESNRILISPHGPDPVYFGIRGESPKIVYSAFKIIQPLHYIERWLIFKSNQGTDMHLIPKKINQLKPYSCGKITGHIVSYPKIIRGGHVILTVSDNTGTLECAVYFPSGNLRKIAAQLSVNDLISVYGCAKLLNNNRLTFNVEKIEILKLAPRFKEVNPLCPKCGKRMSSAGKNKGFKCKKCGFYDKFAKKIISHIPTTLKTGLYLPPPRSQKHLAKPLSRINLYKKINRKIDSTIPWHFP